MEDNGGIIIGLRGLGCDIVRDMVYKCLVQMGIVPLVNHR